MITDIKSDEIIGYIYILYLQLRVQFLKCPRIYLTF